MAKFRIKEHWNMGKKEPCSLTEILDHRRYSSDSGQLEELECEVLELRQLNAALLEKLLAVGVLTSIQICELVNATSGYNIEVADG